MSVILQSIMGHKVQIWSQVGQGTAKDEGKLVAFDDKWVVIEKSVAYGADPETLFFPIANIRLLKPV